MNVQKKFLYNLGFYFAVMSIFLLIGHVINQSATVYSEKMPPKQRTCLVIDAGHGGVDGGAISCEGYLESNINLEIALRLNDMIHILGYNTVMIRTSDMSVYTEGNTISQKKISDLKHRVQIVNSIENGLLVSIHQNNFGDDRYSGAQVFYANTPGSASLAKDIQAAFLATVNRGSKRRAKKSSGVYLMENIQCTGVLIECGFLSNITEEAKLRNSEYQKNLCCIIGSALSLYLDQAGVN